MKKREGPHKNRDKQSHTMSASPPPSTFHKTTGEIAGTH
jgi:hypothetical protein